MPSHQNLSPAEQASAHTHQKTRRENYATPHNPKPWVVVTNPGTDEESIFSDHTTYSKAMTNTLQCNEPCDVMRRRDDGTLTTEY